MLGKNVSEQWKDAFAGNIRGNSINEEICQSR